MAVHDRDNKATQNQVFVNAAEHENEIARLKREIAERDQQICSLIAERDRFQMFQCNQNNLNLALEFLQKVITGENDKEIKAEAIKQWSIIVNKSLFPISTPIEESSSR